MFVLSRWLNRMAESKKLFAAILLFIALDFSILAINYWIAYQLSNDAVSINLSGRQRMLSQQITKSLLALQLKNSNDGKEAFIEEFRNSVKVFDQTLAAFEHGGMVVSGDGGGIILNRVRTAQAAVLISQAQQVWKPMRELLLPYFASKTTIPDDVLLQSRSEMLQINLQLLDLMNLLTSDLEHDSRGRANILRIVQTTVFFLALINFVVVVRRFHLLAQQAHQAKEQFSELALRDPLTGLFNRRYFETSLEREMSVSDRRPERKFAVVVVDLDGFKPINDTFGHEAGDVVLKTVATRLTQYARTNDTVARMGGDEFTLICTDLGDENDAATFCERLLCSINGPIVLDIGTTQVGASIGVAFYPNKTKSESDLMHTADKAMYRAKKEGRNRYVCLSEY